MAVEPTRVAIELELAGAGGGWTDVWSHVRAQVPIVCSYGIQSGGGPADRCAQPGSLTWALDNGPGNGTGIGLYSPTHAAARSGFEIGIGVRFLVVWDSVTYIKFRGRLASVQVTPDAHGPWTTLCTAWDYLDTCNRARLKRVAVQVAQRGDQIFDTLVSEMPEPPTASTSGTGRETYALALDARSPEEGLSVLGEFQRLAMSEAGYIYARGTTSAATAQQLVYESRTERATKNTDQTSLTDADLEGIEIGRHRDRVINRVQVLTHPRRKDAAAVVLYTLRDATVGTGAALELAAGAAQTVTCPYTDPAARDRRCAGTSMITPVASTDYTANAAADGGSTDLVGSLGVAATFGGTSAAVVLTNNHASTTLYVTKLELRGLGIYDEQTTVHEQEDATSQAAYGENVYRYDASYQMSPTVGDSFARHFLGVFSDPQQSAESVSILLNRSAALMLAGLTREVGDRVGVAETVSAIAEGYFVLSVTLTVTPREVIRCRWGLTPASRIRYWLLGTAGASEIGQTTVIGY